MAIARIFVNQPDHWKRFLEWLGRPPELLDPKYENVQNRFPLRQTIDRLVEARTLNYDVKKFFEEFQGTAFGRGADQSAERFSRRRADPAPSLFDARSSTPISAAISFPAILINFPKARGASPAARRCCGEHQSEIDAGMGTTVGLAERIEFDRRLGRRRAAAHSKGFASISFPTGIVGPALGGLLAEHGAEVISHRSRARSTRSPQRGQKFQIASDLES